MRKLSTMMACFLSALVGQSHIANASDQIPGAKQKTPIILMGGTVHTVSGETISPANVLIVDGKIAAVGKEMVIPDQTERIDVTGKHIYPGLIEANSQMGLVEIDSVRATIDSSEIGQINSNVKTQVAFNPDSEAIPVARANGVLFALAVPSGGLISGRSSLMQMDGWTWEDMSIGPNLAMHVTWPRFSAARGGRRGGGGGRGAAAGGGNDAQQRLNELKEWLDNTRTYIAARAADPTGMPKDLRLEGLIPVVEQKIPIIADAEDAQQIQSVVAFAQKNSIKVIIYGGSGSLECASLLKEANVPLILSGVYRLPRNLKAYDESYTLPAKLKEAGVKFCISGAGRFGASTVRNLPYHAATAAGFGLTPEDALRSITLSPAEILGVADRIGSLDAGKDATLFIANGDILEITSQVEAAFVQGRKVDLTNHHTELYKKYSAKYEDR